MSSKGKQIPFNATMLKNVLVTLSLISAYPVECLSNRSVWNCFLEGGRCYKLNSTPLLLAEPSSSYWQSVVTEVDDHNGSPV